MIVPGPVIGTDGKNGLHLLQRKVGPQVFVVLLTFTSYTYFISVLISSINTHSIFN